MAKRFIDTGILKHHFTRGLEAPLKLLYVHILTDCSHAGMWQVDWEIASIIVGAKINPEKAEKAFAGKIVKIKSGAIWFVPDFIDFQYGTLSSTNPAHRGIISILQKENLLNKDYSLKPLTSSFEGAKDMDKEKEKDMDKEKGGAGGKTKTEETINPHPFSIQFMVHWERWLKYKWEEHRDKYKQISTQQVAFNELLALSGENEIQAIELINHAIGKRWKGIYPKHINGKNHSGKNAGAAEISVLAAAARSGVTIPFSATFDKPKGG